MVVAFRTVPAHVRHQVHVRLRVVSAHRAAVEVRKRRAHARLGLARRIVAAYALSVENGLDLADERVVAARAVPGPGRLRLLARGGGHRGGRRLVLVLVAARARDHLARHAHEPGAHLLQLASVLVERLDGERSVRGNCEDGAAVLLEIDLAEDVARVPRTLEADVVVPAHVARRVAVGEEAQLLRDALRNALQAFAEVDVLQIDGAGVHLVVAPVDGHPRALALLDRQRLQAVPFRECAHGHDVVVDVGKRHNERIAVALVNGH